LLFCCGGGGGGDTIPRLDEGVMMLSGNTSSMSCEDAVTLSPADVVSQLCKDAVAMLLSFSAEAVVAAA